MPEIVISEFMEESAVARLAKIHSTLYDPNLYQDVARLRASLRECRALIVRNQTQVQPDLLQDLQNITIIGRLGVGLDNIDLEFCDAGGIEVVPAIGANAISVAELVIGAMFSLLRGTFHVSERLRGGEWPRVELMGSEINGKTLGLIGFGHVATALASRAHCLGMKVLAHDPAYDADDPIWSTYSAIPTTFDHLIAECDVLSIHVPLTNGTRGLIGKAALSRMKSNAIVINTARGGIVDEQALSDSLIGGIIAGAALDVFEQEPIQEDCPLIDAPNVILMPHVGAMTHESNVRVSDMIADAVLSHLRA